MSVPDTRDILSRILRIPPGSLLLCSTATCQHQRTLSHHPKPLHEIQTRGSEEGLSTCGEQRAAFGGGDELGPGRGGGGGGGGDAPPRRGDRGPARCSLLRQIARAGSELR
eukprot:3849206-Rhodomonas_salina.2